VIPAEYSALEWADKFYQQTERKLGFKAKNPHEARLWREALAGKVIELLGGFPRERCDLEVEVVAEQDRGAYIQRTLRYRSDEWSVVPADLLIPKGLKPGEKRPGLIAQHGHGKGRVSVLEWDETDVHHAFGAEFAKRGFVVLAPDARGFGERGEEESRENLNLILLGKTIIGLRVWDAMRGFDLLQSLPEVDPERLGMAGLSGGGTVTTFTAALDERVKACCVSGYIASWRGSIMAMNHCTCNFVPGILEYAENYDVAGLIAPRALIMEAGDKDPIFPLPAVREAEAKLKEIYQVYDAPEQYELHVFEGEHQWSGARSYDFLAEKLGL